MHITEQTGSEGTRVLVGRSLHAAHGADAQCANVLLLAAGAGTPEGAAVLARLSTTPPYQNFSRNSVKDENAALTSEPADIS